MADEIVDLGTDKVHLYRKVTGFPDHLAVIEVSREKVRNAVDGDTAQALTRALDVLDSIPKVRTLFITGSGEKAFVSGGDLRDYTSRLDSVDKVREALSQMRRVLWRNYTGARFVVAVMNGPARGGGSELAFSCHYRVMKEHASLGFVQATQGIPPGWGGGTLLADQVGTARARLALMSGSVFDAEEARKLGFVDEVVRDDANMIERLQHIAHRFSRSTVSGALAVQAILNRSSKELLHNMEQESDACANLWFEPEHQEILKKYS